MRGFNATRRMVVMATVALVAASTVEAQPPHDTELVRRVERVRARAHHWMGEIERLDLKDEQRDKLRQIRRAGLEVMAPKRVAMAQARMDLHDLMEKDASSSDLRNAHAKFAKARSDMQAAAFDLRMQAREVLTPEQRKELRQAPRKGMRRMGALMELDAPLSPGDEDFGMLEDAEWQED